MIWFALTWAARFRRLHPGVLEVLKATSVGLELRMGLDGVAGQGVLAACQAVQNRARVCWAIVPACPVVTAGYSPARPAARCAAALVRLRGLCVAATGGGAQVVVVVVRADRNEPGLRWAGRGSRR